MPALEEIISWDIERRADGAVLVRIHSTGRFGRRLPDAVFAFRPGDPQYDFWKHQLQTRTEEAAVPADREPVAVAG